MLPVIFAASICCGANPKLVVLPISAQRVDAEVVKVLDEILVTEADRVGRFEIMGASDLNAMLGLEKMKSAVGCDDVTCAAEIGGALGAELLLSVNAGVLGDKLELSAKLIDTTAARVLQRGNVSVPRMESEYAGGLRQLVATLFEQEERAPPPGTEIPAEHAAAVAASGLAYADWLVLQQFGSAGLGRAEYDEWRGSGLLYPQWAQQRNDASESWILEGLKWVATGLTAIFLVIEVVDQSDPDNALNQHGYLTFAGSAAGIGAIVWAIDLVQIGNVPQTLPEQQAP